MRRFGITFVLILVGLFAAELTPPVQRWFVQPWTTGVAAASTALIKLFDPAVLVYGATIASARNGFSVTILAGCNGVEAMIVLAAGMLAYPAPWKSRAAGLVVGTLAIQALNLVRIASLFYLGQWNREVFEWAHLYAWPVLIMVDALVVWLVWLRMLPPDEARA